MLHATDFSRWSRMTWPRPVRRNGARRLQVGRHHHRRHGARLLARGRRRVLVFSGHPHHYGGFGLCSYAARIRFFFVIARLARRGLLRVLCRCAWCHSGLYALYRLAQPPPVRILPDRAWSSGARLLASKGGGVMGGE